MLQEADDPFTYCLCSDDNCQCAIETLRDRRLQALLIESQEDVSDGRLRFIPREAILRQIRSEFVLKILRKIASQDGEQLQEASNRISPSEDCYCKDALCTGRRVIFTSLLFAGLHELLELFLYLDEIESCDSHLWKLSQDTIYGDEDPLFQHIRQLSGTQKDLFFHWEYQLRALCFPKKDDGGQINKLELKDGLEDKIRLPWTSIEQVPRSSSIYSTRSSTKPRNFGMQSAKVEKICIHRSHHKLDNSTNCFALKTMLDGFGPEISRANFDQELRANNALPRDEHILPLLVAFEHRDNLHFVFPWAELGDLESIWKRYSPRGDTLTGQQTHAVWYSSKWLLGECFGIASALADIHGRPESTERPHCLLHGDIKPENILGFRDRNTVSLKLADFGHAHILDAGHRTVPVRSMASQRSYRAPEYDMEEVVTTKYDVWALGCLFLDFITWALLGWEDVKNFRQQRFNEKNDAKADYGNLSEAAFFKKVAGRRAFLSFPVRHSFMRRHSISIRRLSHPAMVLVQDSVTSHIKKLRDNKGCDGNIRRLLNVVENKMLVPDCSNRAWSDEVRDKISKILLRNIE